MMLHLSSSSTFERTYYAVNVPILREGTTLHFLKAQYSAS
jgi:hypothetical protein